MQKTNKNLCVLRGCLCRNNGKPVLEAYEVKGMSGSRERAGQVENMQGSPQENGQSVSQSRGLGRTGGHRPVTDGRQSARAPTFHVLVTKRRGCGIKKEGQGLASLPRVERLGYSQEQLCILRAKGARADI